MWWETTETNKSIPKIAVAPKNKHPMPPVLENLAKKKERDGTQQITQVDRWDLLQKSKRLYMWLESIYIWIPQPSVLLFPLAIPRSV